MAVLVALIRGFKRHSAETIGNFWFDLTRSTLYILMPLALIWSLLLVSQGVVQTFSEYKTVSLTQTITYDTPKLDAQGNPIKDEKGNPVTEKAEMKEQVIPLGPAASQIAIKQLGTNGGGFFNVNSAHPFENPTAFSNFLEMLALILIPAALCITFGKMVGDKRQGWALLSAMTIVLVTLMALCTWSEQGGNPRFASIGIDQQASNLQPGGNMEGKEARFGIVDFRDLGHGDHSGLERLGQFHARFLHAHGRPVPAGTDAVGRGHLRRRRLRALRHADHGHYYGLHSRSHGRPHAGVSGQEDRDVRDEDGLGRGAGRECAGQDRHGSRRCDNSGSCRGR